METSDADEGTGEGLTPDEAFASLGNERRVDILRAMWDAIESSTVDEWTPTRLSYSELQELTDVRDSGQFNYHLSKLVPHFIEGTEAGYVLTCAGGKVVRSIVAGTVTADLTITDADTDTACVVCGAPVVISYEDTSLFVRCTRCEGTWGKPRHLPRTLLVFDFPPVGLEGRSPEETLHAMFEKSMHRVISADDGLCLDCSGQIETTAHICEAHHVEDERVCEACQTRYRVRGTMYCDTCKSFIGSPAFVHVLDHPAVTTFYGNRGIEHVWPSWEAFARAHGYGLTVGSGDQPQIRVTVPCEGDELRRSLRCATVHEVP